jgi:hypothetical protein
MSSRLLECEVWNRTKIRMGGGDSPGLVVPEIGPAALGAAVQCGHCPSATTLAQPPAFRTRRWKSFTNVVRREDSLLRSATRVGAILNLQNTRERTSRFEPARPCVASLTPLTKLRSAAQFD